MIKAVIIDDDQDAIDYVRYLSGQRRDLIISGEAVNVEMGLRECMKIKPDLVFLDIDMPGKNGLDFLEMDELNDHKFKTIFTTGYKEFAIEAIKKGAHDYLLKPLDKQEFNVSIDRLFLEDYLLLKNGQMVRLTDIIIIRSVGNDLEYILNSHKNTVTVRQTLKDVLRLLPDAFIQVHRSYIINRNYIKMVNNHSVMMSNKTTINISPKMNPRLFHNKN